MRQVQAQLKFFNLARGFGFFVSPEIDGDIFVHMETLKADGWVRIAPFQSVLAVVKKTEKGWIACRVFHPNRERSAP